ncbi:MAG: DNA-directed RNA polymerase subunit P [Thermoprotei archaeon]|nr:MAG: DNA-directed RNA polymerase subunit P [Thermoprotei archaeon]
MTVCYHCGKALRADEVVELRTVCPYCMADIVVRLCPKCAREVAASLLAQAEATEVKRA